jgi:hypothetical protein
MNSQENKSSAIIEETKIIDSLINQGCFIKALEKFKNYEKHHPNDQIILFNKCAFFIDIGWGLKDSNLVQIGLDTGEKNLTRLKAQKFRENIHYYLATGYTYLFDLLERKTGIEAIPQSCNLQKAKSHFRSAIKLPNKLTKQMWVNYGNYLDTLGRGIEALFTYDNALRIDKNFSMAIGNKAKALRFFADISGKYREAIYAQSYQSIQSIINNPDLIESGGLIVKQSFESELRRIEALCNDNKLLTKKINHLKYKEEKLSHFEKFYLELCSKERLFLNFHIHAENCEAAISDPIFIRLTTNVNDQNTFYDLAKYINQIKEDYAVARLLLVQSQFKRNDFDNISQRTTLVNCLDYSQFNLYIGLLKSSFKEAYNILDKIAVFINEYCNLGLPEGRIYFTTIWQKKEIIRDEILKTKNISLYALYDINQDFRSNHYKKIQDIRNALTHRRLVIFDSMLRTDWDKKDDKYNIGSDTMLDKTIELLQLTKSAIIYLINFVNNEEKKKRNNGHVVPYIYADTSQFL